MGRKGGRRTAETRPREVQVEMGRRFAQWSAENMTQAEHIENGRKGGALGGFAQRGTCPHCGFETNRAALVKYHNENCKQRPRAR